MILLESCLEADPAVVWVVGVRWFECGAPGLECWLLAGWFWRCCARTPLEEYFPGVIPREVALESTAGFDADSLLGSVGFVRLYGVLTRGIAGAERCSCLTCWLGGCARCR